MKLRHVGFYILLAFISPVVATPAHAKGDSVCEDKLTDKSEAATTLADSFEAQVLNKAVSVQLLRHGVHFKKFFAWALDSPEETVDAKSIKAIGAMLKLSKEQFEDFFSNLEISQEKFSESAQQLVDLLTQADKRFAVKGAKLSEVDDDVFSEWNFKEQKTNVRAIALYRVEKPDQESEAYYRGDLPDLTTVAPRGRTEWRFEKFPRFSPIVDDHAEPLHQKIEIAGRQIVINGVQTFAEREHFDVSASRRPQFLAILGLDGEDQVHLRYEFLSAQEQPDAQTPYLKEVWVRDERGSWSEVSSKLDGDVKAATYLKTYEGLIALDKLKIRYLADDQM